MSEPKSEAPDKVQAAGGSFTTAVQGMFDSIAPRYDTFNRWASLGMDEGWRRAAIRRLGPLNEGLVLDVATGTGDVALAAARAGARVIGTDFAANMIGAAAAKARRAGMDARVRFHVARAERLPHADARFIGVTSAFAMRNVRPMLDEVLAEMLRVLRPGGRLVILEFSEPPWAWARWGHRVYTRWLVPAIGRLVTGDGAPFEYLNRSIDAWESAPVFADRIARTGFVDVGYRLLSLGAVALHWGRKRE